MPSKEEQLRGLKNAWLSPDGKIVVDADDFAPLGAWHEELAQCIARDLLHLRQRSKAMVRMFLEVVGALVLGMLIVQTVIYLFSDRSGIAFQRCLLLVVIFVIDFLVWRSIR